MFAKYTTNDYQEGNLFFGTKTQSEWTQYSHRKHILTISKQLTVLLMNTTISSDIQLGGQFVHR
jgi:hypothetical protein